MRLNSPQEGARRRFLLCLILVCSLALPAAAQQAPSIAIDPDCGPEATGQPDEPHYEIAVQGSGFEPGKDVEINFAGERQDDPEQQDVVADENGAFSTTIRPARRSTGTYEVEALQRDEEGNVSTRATASFTVPCPEPEPTAEPSPTEPSPSPDPSPTKKPDGKKDKEDKKGPRKFKPRLDFETTVGPPGSVVHVSGRGFPAKTKLVLDWNEGAGTFRVQTNGKGRFRIGVLVFPNDVLGPRQLVATGRRFRAARIRFLVVPSTAGPPDFVNR